MKTLSVTLCLACALAFGVAGADAHWLGKGGARAAAEVRARDFALSRSWLNDSEVNRCARRSALRVDCVAVVAGDTETKSSRCRLLIVVRAVSRHDRWGRLARIGDSRCTSLRLPVLGYADATQAIQAEADRFAGQPTTISSLKRRDARTFRGFAEWDRLNPTGCQACGYDPTTGQPVDKPTTESCSVELVATRLGDDSIAVEIKGSTCD